MPGVAPAAKQMGDYVGRLDRRALAGRAGAAAVPLSRTRATLATIGRRAAVVKFGRLQLKGFVGWLFWSVAHIYFLIGLRNRFIVAFTWVWELPHLPARRAADHRAPQQRAKPSTSTALKAR